MKFVKLKWFLVRFIRFGFLFLGLNWRDFYSWLLNRIERNNNFDIIKNRKRKYGFYSLEMGEKDLDFLISQNMNENDTFLDYGCGYGRTSNPVVKYLNKNKYVGIDLSKERIRIAKEYIRDCGLEYKEAEFYVSYKKKLNTILKDRKFKIIFIYTVMVHNPISEVKKILEEAKEYLDKDGIIFFDYWRPNPNDKIQSVKDFVIRKEQIEKILTNLNFDYSDIESFIKFQPDKTETKFHRMMRLTMNG